MNGLLSNPLFVTAIDNPDGNKLGLISAAYPLGGLVGIFPAPIVADRLGRRAAILTGALLIIAGSIVQTFTKGGNAMLGGRLIVGIGSSFQVSRRADPLSPLIPSIHTKPISPSHMSSVASSADYAPGYWWWSPCR
jgi:MFS family permease